MALTRAKLEELISNGDIDVGGGLSNPMPNTDLIVNLNADKLDGYHASDLALLAYPIGAIYQSLTATSPATLFGGTWAAIGAGTFLVAAGTDYEAGSTGGEAKHALTVAELASHRHVQSYFLTSLEIGPTPNTAAMSGGTPGDTPSFQNTQYTGSGTAHENRPPYYAVYMWRRTA